MSGLRENIDKARAALAPDERQAGLPGHYCLACHDTPCRWAAAQVPAQDERSTKPPLIADDLAATLDRLRAVETAARRFLDAAQLESMTKAPAYIKAKRALRAALR